MANYTVVNLRDDIPDMAPRFSMGDGIEAHFGRQALELSKSGVSYFKLGPDYRLPFGHSHAEQEEIYIVVGGTVRLKLDEDELELKRLDAVRIPESVVRGMAGGPDGGELIAFGAPNTENKDITMVQGFFSD
jgi:mannose-6-phosphate isomerase-like protein (cupin superfamily)